mgnify:CR=1 FL=1
MKYIVNINIDRQMTDFVPISGKSQYDKSLSSRTENMSAITKNVKVFSMTKTIADENKLSAENLMTKIKQEMNIKSVVSENLYGMKGELTGSTVVESFMVSYNALLLPPTIPDEMKNKY